MADENIVIPGLLDQEHEQHEVRLSGIDAPGKSQPFGQQAKKRLSGLAHGRSVSVERRKRDRYRRIVGKVFEGGRGVNLEQGRRGLAWHYQQYQNEQDALNRGRYATAETVREPLPAAEPPPPPRAGAAGPSWTGRPGPLARDATRRVLADRAPLRGACR